MTETSHILENALAKHQNGQVDEARKLYEQVLAMGDNAEAFHWLGILELQSGAASTAVELLTKASKIDSTNAQLLANLGNACFAASQPNKAVEAYSESLLLNPASPETLASLGNLLLATEEPQQAIINYEKALQLNPQLAEVWRGLATALLARGEHGRALDAIGRAEQEHARSGQPITLPLLFTRGNVLIGAGLTEQALACFQTAVDRAPKFAQAHISLGGAHRVLGNFEVAIEHCRKAIALEPVDSKGYYALGLVQLDQGDLAHAKASFECTLEYDSANGRAHRLIASLTRHTAEHPHIHRMRQALTVDGLSSEQSTHLHYGLGKALEDAALYEDAYAHIQQANHLHRQQTTYTIDYDVKWMAQTRRVFTEDFLVRHKPDTNTLSGFPRPIFVVGMPRSGTSLIEQILASHPDVYGAGELDWIERCTEDAFRESGPTLGGIEKLMQLETGGKESLRKIGKAYLSRIAALAPNSRFVVDKMPANFLQVGLIRCALPDAVIVHARRHPMATCWSIYKNYLGAQGHAYSFDQTELGHYYQLYRQLMSHWDDVVGEGIHHVDYEALVSDQETVSRRLVAHCGLGWDKACLDFHTNKRPVRTLSAAQVRQPMYADALAQWEHYSTHLEPLTQALGDGLLTT